MDVSNDGAPQADGLRRAQQRLSQEAGGARGPGIDSLDEARRRLAGVKDQIDAQPQAVLMAHAAVDRTLFEAAMARPRG
jgi:broad specificity phosphatase PhoE